MHFVIQNNINENDYNKFVDAIERNGHTYQSFFHIPFDTAYPEFGQYKELFVYAASAVTDQIFNDYLGFKGVYNHTTSLNINNYYDKNPELMWSKRIKSCSLVDVLKLDITDDLIFTRPALDNKLFSGQVVKQSDFREQVRKMLNADESLIDEEIFIGEVDYPELEYRVFIVDGAVASSSLYRKNGYLFKQYDSPLYIKEFAVNFYDENYLPICCVIDIGVKKSKIGVIEVNSINNSGFYEINLDNLVNALAERNYP